MPPRRKAVTRRALLQRINRRLRDEGGGMLVKTPGEPSYYVRRAGRVELIGVDDLDAFAADLDLFATPKEATHG